MIATFLLEGGSTQIGPEGALETDPVYGAEHR